MKRTILGALIAAFACGTPVLAQGLRDLPGGLVMTEGPLNDMIAQGIVLPRFAHAENLPEGDFTRIRIRFLGSFWEQTNPCRDPGRDDTAPCYPNAYGHLDFRIRTDPASDDPTRTDDDSTASIQLGGHAVIDRATYDLTYLGWPVAIFMADDLTLTRDGGDWLIASPRAAISTRWRPLPLADAADTVAFAASFGRSLTDLGPCILGQVIAMGDDIPPELAANITETGVSGPGAFPEIDQPANEPPAPRARLRSIALLLLTRAETMPATADEALAAEPLKSLAERYGSDFVTRDFDRLRLAAIYEKRKSALGKLDPAEARKRICEHLAAP